MRGSIGVIGGADGPTAVLVTGDFHVEIIIAAIVLAVIVTVLFIIRKKRKNRK